MDKLTSTGLENIGYYGKLSADTPEAKQFETGSTIGRIIAHAILYIKAYLGKNSDARAILETYPLEKAFKAEKSGFAPSGDFMYNRKKMIEIAIQYANEDSITIDGTKAEGIIEGIDWVKIDPKGYKNETYRMLFGNTRKVDENNPDKATDIAYSDSVAELFVTLSNEELANIKNLYNEYRLALIKCQSQFGMALEVGNNTTDEVKKASIAFISKLDEIFKKNEKVLKDFNPKVQSPLVGRKNKAV